jgi:hypothetical protein
MSRTIAFFPVSQEALFAVLADGYAADADAEILEADAPRRMVLHARTRPFATARITLELVQHDAGTRVTMDEQPRDLLSRLVHNPLADRLLGDSSRASLLRLGQRAAATSAEAAIDEGARSSGAVVRTGKIAPK